MATTQKFTNSNLATYRKLTKKCYIPRDHDICRITPHHMAAKMTARQCTDYFYSTSREVSSTYTIGYDGSIAQCVDEANGPWTSSSKANDMQAVTIEVSNSTGDPTWKVSDASIKALIDLCVDICKRYNKTKLLWFNDKTKSLNYKPKSNEMVFTVHRWFAATGCPGDYLYSKLGYIADEVNKKLGTGGSTSTISTSAPPTSTSSTTNKTMGGNPLDIASKISSGYGPRTGGLPTPHKGIDIIATNGTAANVLAKYEGTITYVVNNVPDSDTAKYDNIKKTYVYTGKNSSGNQVWMKDTNGNTIKFFHLKYGSIPSTIRVGARVKVGTKIGVMGKTGWSTGIHLHYQMEDVNGNVFDPTPYYNTLKKALPVVKAATPSTSSSTSPTFSKNDIVKFNGGDVYGSSTSTTATNTVDKASIVKITNVSYTAKHQYHCISQDGAGVYGWVDASTLSKLHVEYTVKVVSPPVNIRKGPGTNYAKTGKQITSGSYTIIEESNGPGAKKWGKLKSGAGWVALDYFKKV